MELFFLSIIVLLCGAVLAWIFSFRAKFATFFGAGSTIIAAFLGVWSGIAAILADKPLSYSLPWQHLPFASFSFNLDPLAGFFVAVILGISGLAAVYGTMYWKKYRHEHNLGGAWFFYNILVAAMATVVTAANGVLFLIAWEIMTLSAFFLIIFEHERPEVRHAGILYLIAGHIGAAFLFVMFWIFASYTKSMDFSTFKELPLAPEIATIIFLCSLVGFGSKAGIVPFHVWLPYAHPAAPSHVSAVMSGVMIKTGVYGILRTMTFLGTPHLSWGITLTVLGCITGIMGIFWALTQHDIKKFLAYSSVENIGIIFIGIGIGICGTSLYTSTSNIITKNIAMLLGILGFSGSILHIFNHSIFKSLLFLSAGTVAQQTHTRDFESLGGLLKKMPKTGISFMIGAIAISALPPLNGFISEFFLYMASFKYISSMEKSSELLNLIGLPIISILSLVLIGGLALASFTKAFSITFLGTPRSETATSEANDPHWIMILPMIILAGACFLVSIFIVWFGPQFLAPVLTIMLPNTMSISSVLSEASTIIAEILKISIIFGIILVGVILLRNRMLKSRTVTKAGTWDCGYLAASSKVQYTASSFSQPINDLFAYITGYSKKLEEPKSYFSNKATFSSHSKDIFMEFFNKIFHSIAWIFKRLDWLQHGKLHLYLLYIAGTLIILLIWLLGF